MQVAVTITTAPTGMHLLNEQPGSPMPPPRELGNTARALLEKFADRARITRELTEQAQRAIEAGDSVTAMRLLGRISEACTSYRYESEAALQGLYLVDRRD